MFTTKPKKMCTLKYFILLPKYFICFEIWTSIFISVELIMFSLQTTRTWLVYLTTIFLSKYFLFFISELMESLTVHFCILFKVNWCTCKVNSLCSFFSYWTDVASIQCKMDIVVITYMAELVNIFAFSFVYFCLIRKMVDWWYYHHNFHYIHITDLNATIRIGCQFFL